MGTNYSLVIMAHKKRERSVAALLEQLGDTEVVWDRKNNRWDTGSRSMAAFDQTKKYHVVLQDDAIICKDFLEGLDKALDAVPNVPAVFYTGRVRPRATLIANLTEKAVREKKSWLELPGPWWGPCIAMPTEVIPDMLRFCNSVVKDPNYDIRMSRYFRYNRILNWYSLPSLVDHLTGPDHPSLVPGRSASPKRTAHRFIGEQSPLDIDWDTGAISEKETRPAVRIWTNSKTQRTRRVQIGSPQDQRHKKSKLWTTTTA